MKRYKLDGTFYFCPVDLTLSVIGGRWKGIVFWNLRNGPKRYGEMKKALVCINDKMLSQSVKIQSCREDARPCGRNVEKRP